MGTTVNLVMTTFGFLVSTIFIIFVLFRLLCRRLQTRLFVSEWARGSFLNPDGEHGVNGMDPLLLTLFPTIKFSGEVFASQEDATCAVCLGEYEDRDSLRILPQCGHAFHVNCIDAWLRHHPTCPVCRIHLQSSPTRRNILSPLLSEAARSRFSPGAIPESLFEQPLVDSSSPVTGPGSRQQLTSGAVHQHNAHVIQLLETKDCSQVATYTSNSSSQIQESFQVCVVTNGISSTERMPCTGEADDASRDLQRLSRGDAGSMVQVQLQAGDSFCRQNDGSLHTCMLSLSNGFSAARCLVDDDFGHRSSFSSWIRRSHENSIVECSNENVESMTRKELLIDERPEDLVLGWTTLTFHTPNQQQVADDVRLKIDGM